MWSLGAGSRMRYGANAITAVHGFYVQLVDFAARLEEQDGHSNPVRVCVCVCVCEYMYAVCFFVLGVSVLFCMV